MIAIKWLAERTRESLTLYILSVAVRYSHLSRFSGEANHLSNSYNILEYYRPHYIRYNSGFPSQKCVVYTKGIFYLYGLHPSPCWTLLIRPGWFWLRILFILHMINLIAPSFGGLGVKSKHTEVQMLVLMKDPFKVRNVSTSLRTPFLNSKMALLLKDQKAMKCQGKSWLIRKRDTSWYNGG